MVATIYEPSLPRQAAVLLIEQELRNLHASCAHQPGPVRRATLNNLAVDFLDSRGQGTPIVVRDGLKLVLKGRLDPTPKRLGKYANGRFGVSHWVRGRWEDSFGVPMDSFDPHWDDRIPPVLIRAIRKAASSPGSAAAKQVLDLMNSYADSRFEGFFDDTLKGDEHAGELACLVVTGMRGPNMAAMVPLMMWVNGAPSLDVLQAYAEAHRKLGVRRRHLRQILGTGDRVADFLGFAAGADALERSIEILRAMPQDEAVKLIDAIALDRSPLVQQIFPEGLEAFLQGFLSNPNLNLRQTLAVKRRGLFS